MSKQEGVAVSYQKPLRQLVADLADKQKTSKGASAYARFINRPIGRWLAAVSFKLRLTPNQVSGISGVFSLAGILLIVLWRPSLTSGIVIAALLALGYAFDSADGQLARLRGGGSFAGEWLDHVIDAAKMSAFHLAVLIAWFRFWDLDFVWYLAPVAYEFLAVLLFFTIVLTDQMRRTHRGSSQMRLAGEGHSSLVYSLAVLPTEYGVIALSFFLWGWTEVFPWVYLTLLLVNIVFLTLALPKWFKEIRAFGSVG